jgi:hypothetical protein
MAAIFNQTYKSTKDNKQGCKTVFTSSICYSLVCNTMTLYQLLKIQEPVIHSVLSRMGFNQHMPRNIVYASKLRGGLWLLDLYLEQGSAQTQLLVSHMQSKSYLYKSFLTLLESFQVSAGLTQSTLLHTHPVLYIQSPLIQSVCEFPHRKNLKLIFSKLTYLKFLRQYDQPIMN